MILYHYIHHNRTQTLPVLQAKRTQNIIEMQLTTVVAFLAAAASAAPGTLSPRQSGSVRARFYDENNCGKNGELPGKAELTLRTSAAELEGKPGCVDLTIGPYSATFFDQSTLEKTSKFKRSLVEIPFSRRVQ